MRALALTMTILLAGCLGPDRRAGAGPGAGGGGDVPGGGVEPGDEGEGEPDPGEEPEPEPDPDPVEVELPDLSGCGAVALEELEASASTEGADNDFGSTCNHRRGKGGGDALFVWGAPLAGRWRFSTEGSGFDTVISLRKPSCDPDQAEVRGCNDDVGENVQWSQQELDLEAGESVLVVVDGFRGRDAGDARLRIERVEALCEDGRDNDGDGESDCDDSDCADAPGCGDVACPEAQVSVGELQEGRTGGRGESDALGPGSLLGDASCGDGGGGAPEAVFGFTAPGDGRFVFSTRGSDFDTLLYARQEWCTGRELACDDDGAGGKASELSLDLEEGQEIVLVVDGWGDETGAFRLSVNGVELRCDDGVDDDGDGDVDCDDEDCLTIECATGGAWRDEWAEMEDEVLVLVNERRAEGAMCANDRFPPVGPLEMNEVLRLSSRLHSLDMGERNFFEHDNLDGQTPFDRIEAAGFRGGGPTGENIAAGQTNAEEVVEAWMNSPGHCRNIMDSDYRVIGVGYAFTIGSDFGHYWTQNFGGSH